MKFADILASLIHDMKNSLGMVINTLEEVSGDSQADEPTRHKMRALQQEAKRLNNNLIELLTLYKIENEHISANIEEWNISDFLEEIAAENQTSARVKGVRLEWVCDEELSGYFDEGLLRGVINSLACAISRRPPTCCSRPSRRWMVSGTARGAARPRPEEGSPRWHSFAEGNERQPPRSSRPLWRISSSC